MRGDIFFWQRKVTTMVIRLLFVCIVGMLTPLVAAAQPQKKPRTDSYGDPLPPHALFRLGTIRLRHGSPATALAFSADGKRLVSVADNLETHIWDVATSKEVLYRKGQEGFVGPMVLSQDGKCLAVIRERSCELRDVASGKLLHTLDGHEGLVKKTCFSPDGKLLATAADNGEVDLWEVATGKKRWHYRHSNYSTDGMFIAFTGDSKILLFDDGHGSLLHLGVKAGKIVYRRQANSQIGEYRCLGFSPDGRSFLTFDGRDRFVVRQSKTGQSRHEFEDERLSPAYTIGNFSRDGSIVAINEYDGNILLWNTIAKKKLQLLCGHRGTITALSFSADGKLLASSSGDNTIRLWRVASGKELLARRGHQSGFINACFVNDGKNLLSLSWNPYYTIGNPTPTVHVWDPDSGKISRSITFDNRNTHTFDPDLTSAKVMHQESEKTVRVVNVCNNKTLLRKTFSSIHACRLSAEGDLLIVLVSEPRLRVKNKERANKSSLQIWNVNTGRRMLYIRDIVLPSTDSSSVFLSPDKKTVGVLSFAPTTAPSFFAKPAERSYDFWDAATGKKKSRIKTTDLLIPHSFSPNGRYVRMEELWDGLRKARKVLWWDVNRGKKVAGSEHQTSNRDICTSGSRRLLFCSASPGQPFNRNFFLSEMQTGLPIYQEKLPASNTCCAAFSPDDRLVAVGTYQGQIFLYDIINRKPLGRLTGHRGRVWSLSFSSDGQRLASGSFDTTILIWDLAPFWKKRETGPIKIDAKKLDKLWQQLAHKDAAKAYEAIGLLVRGSKQSVPFLRQKLQPVRTVKPAVIQKAIADLDSNKFAVREKAEQKLVQLDNQAVPALQKELRKDLPLETHLRIKRILTRMEEAMFGPERLRQLRALQALEWIGNKEARELLTRLASGVDDAWLTVEARVSLEYAKRIARKGK